jgi:phage host-nuclease inhibitor protein Gam
MKPIKTWDEADNCLAEILALDLYVEKNNTDMDRRCQEIKEKFGRAIKECDASQKKLIEGLSSFFIAHEDDPEVKGKTHETVQGKCGLRLTPPSVKPIGKMSWERVLTRIIDLGYKSKLLRPLVHTIKDIDREKLASDQVTDDVLKSIGVRRHQEERFWYEAK